MSKDKDLPAEDQPFDPLSPELLGLFDDDTVLQERLKFFFRGTSTVILPIDHGTAIPVPGLENLPGLVGTLGDSIDGVVMNYGAARSCRETLEGVPFCLRTDLYKLPYEGNPDPGPTMLFDIEAAMRLEADAVMNMLYTHHPNEATIFQNCSRLISECHEESIPVILETLPFGIGRPDDYTVDNIRFAVRSACELGADLVKTAYPGDKDGFASIVEEAFVPVVVLGGAASGDESKFLQDVADAMEAGAVGVAIGRNVWQHKNPEKMAAALHRIVHEGASAKDAESELKS
ncbi:MAG: hypothetical protein AAGA58_18630 [Verrucomicrobiota bacterium]